MVRVKRGNVARKRRKKILDQTKGFKSSNARLFKVAHQQYLKSLSNSYTGRKKRKRDFRRLWISRIGSIARQNGQNYSSFISNLKKQKISLNRKVLSILLTHVTGFYNKVSKD